MINPIRYKVVAKGDLKPFKYRIKTFIPNPQEDDYKRGYIVRYFLQKANDSQSFVYEISKDTYGKFVDNKLFIVKTLDWRIIGEDSEIRKSNLASINIASKKLKGIKLYLPNLLQFRKK